MSWITDGARIEPEDIVAHRRAFASAQKAVEAAVYAVEYLARVERSVYGPGCDVIEDWADKLADILGDIEQSIEALEADDAARRGADEGTYGPYVLRNGRRLW